MLGHDTLPERKLFPQHFYTTYQSTTAVHFRDEIVFVLFWISAIPIFMWLSLILFCLSQEEPSLLNSIFYAYLASTNSGSSVRLISDSLIYLLPRWVSIFFVRAQSWSVVCSLLAEMSRLEIARMPRRKWDGGVVWTKWTWEQENWNSKKQFSLRNGLRQPAYYAKIWKIVSYFRSCTQKRKWKWKFLGPSSFL